MSGYSLCREGLALLLSNQFEQLDQVLDEAVHQVRPEQGRARVAALRALNVLISGITTFEREKLDASLQSMWETERIARACPTLDGKLAQAEAHLLGGLVQVLQESFIKAAWNFRKSKRMYDDVAVLLQDYKGDDKDDLESCALFGQGAFQLFVSCLPPSAVVIAGWLGFPADREHGLSLLNQSHSSMKLMAPLSALVLLMFYLNIAPHIGCQTQRYLQDSHQITTWALQEYPNAFFFLYFAARLRRCKSQLGESLQLLEQSERAAHGIPAFTHLVSYDIGWCHYIQLEFGEAAVSLQKILTVFDENTKNKANIRAFYAYHIGLCFALMHQPKRAMEYMGKVPGYMEGNLRSIDLYCRRKAAQAVADDGYDAVLDGFELLVVWNAFSLMPGNVRAKALEILDKAKAARGEDWATGDVMRWHLYRGYILWTDGRKELAQKEYDAIFSCNDRLDKRCRDDGVQAMAYYTYSLLLLKAGDLEEAATSLKHAEKVSNYSLQRLMSFRLYSLKQTIQHRLDDQCDDDVIIT